MSGFKVGEIVDITIKGAEVLTEGTTEEGFRFLDFIHGEIHSRTQVHLDASVTIERVAPTVSLADLWRDAQGTLWFVVQTDEPDAPLEMRGHCDSVCSPAYVATTFGPLTLVHREAKAEPLLDPDCRDGKHASCFGEPCECHCHPEAAE